MHRGEEEMNFIELVKKKYIRLSKGQRKVAQFIIDNPNAVATNIASDVGRLAGVSESTVIRFCYAVDLTGFLELQQKVRDYLMERDGVAPAVKQSAAPKDTYADVLSNDVNSISYISSTIDKKVLNNFAKYLIDAKDIYVLGFRTTMPTASWFCTHLSLIRDGLHFVNFDAKSIASSIAKMKKGNVLVLISKENDAEDLEAVIEFATRKGVKVILIADEVQDGFKQQLTMHLSVKWPRVGIENMALMSMLHAVLMSTIEKMKKKQERKNSKNLTKNTEDLQGVS